MEDENDSDKENKDPSTFSVLNHTPLSKKKRGKRRKERGIANLSTLPHTYPLEIDEVFSFYLLCISRHVNVRILDYIRNCRASGSISNH